jgi:hypothetical protein
VASVDPAAEVLRGEESELAMTGELEPEPGPPGGTLLDGPPV